MDHIKSSHLCLHAHKNTNCNNKRKFIRNVFIICRDLSVVFVVLVGNLFSALSGGPWVSISWTSLLPQITSPSSLVFIGKASPEQVMTREDEEWTTYSWHFGGLSSTISSGPWRTTHLMRCYFFFPWFLMDHVSGTYGALVVYRPRCYKQRCERSSIASTTSYPHFPFLWKTAFDSAQDPSVINILRLAPYSHFFPLASYRWYGN